MKIFSIFLAAVWFILSMPDHARSEPITIAIFGAAFASTFAGGLVSMALGLAFSYGVGLIQKAMARRKMKDQTRGISFELQVGDDQPMSFTVGKFAAGGRRKYTGIHGTDNRHFVDVIELGNLPVPGQPEIWVNDQKAVIDWNDLDADGRGYVVSTFNTDGKKMMWVKYYDGTQTAADPYLLEVFGNEEDRPWTSEMIGRGCPYLIVTARFNQEVFPNVPAILTEMPVKPMYDLRKDSTNGGSGTHRWNDQSTWEPSTNPIIIIYNIIRGVYYGTEWVYGGQNLAAFRLPASNWIAAANECDVSIAITGGGTEKQFQCGYEVFCDAEPLTVIEELLQGCNGRLAEVGGIFKVLVGAPGAAVFSFTDDDILVTEGQSYNPFPPFSDTHNGIEATYPEPAEKWASKDAPSRYSTTYMAADLDQQLVVGVQFDAVPFKRQVQRLMKTMLKEERRFRSHEFYLPPSAWRLEPNDVVSWTSDRNGYINKKFLVVRIVGRRNFNQLISLKEIDPSDYDWEASEEIPTVVGPVMPITPEPQPMTGWTAVGYTVKDSGSRNRRPGIKVTASANLDDVKNVRVQVRLKTPATLVFDSDAAPYDAPYEWIISGQWTLPNTIYQARGILIPYTNRQTVWSAWLDVTTPNVQMIGDDILDGAIVATKINDAAITASKIANDAVTELKIADRAISTLKIQLLALDSTLLANNSVISSKIADGAMTLTKFASGLEPVGVIAGTTVPTTKTTNAITVDGKLYRWNGTAYVATVPTADLVGTVSTAQIANDAITNAKLADLAVALANIQDGAVTAAKIADASISTAKFASGIEPVGIIAGTTVPTTKTTNVITVNGKMYRWNGTAYVASVPAVDVTGQLTNAQLEDIATTKLTGTISTTQIADNAITNLKLGPLAVDASKLATNAITETKIADNAISTGKLQANSIVGDKLAANVITAREMVLQDTSNVFPDYDMMAQTGFYTGMGGGVADFFGSSVSTRGKNVLRMYPNVAATSVYSDWISVELGEYYAEVSASVDDGRAGVYIQFATIDAAGVPTYNSRQAEIVDRTGPVSTARVGAAFSVEGTERAIRVRFYRGAGGSDQAFFGGVLIRKKANANLIVDGAVTADKILAGAIVAGKIAADAVTANTIAANAITAAKIEAGAVIAGKIAANAVTATTIASEAIIAGKIAAGAVSATEIAANAITTAKIFAGAVTATELATNSVIAVKIAANAITADKIAANVIGARQLIVSDFSNLILDSEISDASNWDFYVGDGWSSGWSIVSNSQSSGLRAIRFTGFGSSTDISQRASTIDYIPVETEKEYAAGGIVDMASGFNGRTRIGIYWYDSAKVFLASSWQGYTATSTSPQTTSGIAKAPVGAVYARFMIQVLFPSGGGTISSYADFRSLFMRRAAGGELIVDGSITADKITSNAITSAKINADAVTAGKIAANAVTADTIAANAITSGKIAAGSIAASHIQANVVGAKQLIVADFSNLILDNALTDIANWSLAGTGWDIYPLPASSYGAAGGRGWRSIPSASAASGTTYIGSASTADYIPVEVTKEYSYGAHLNPSGGATGTVQLTLYFYNSDKSNIGQDDLSFNAASTTAEVQISKTVAMPALTSYVKYSVRRYSTTQGGNGGTGNVYVYNCFLRRSASGELIVDGAIIADKIAANAVTTAKINAGAVTATEIATNAITAIKIAASTITGSKIAANTISADKLVANTITARELILTDFSNVYPDFDFVAQSGFYSGTGAGVADFYGTTTVTSGKNKLRIYAHSDPASSRSVYSDWTTVETGDYYGEIYLGITTGDCRAYVQFGTIDAAGVATYNNRQALIAQKVNDASGTRIGANFAVTGSERAIRIRYYRAPGGTEEALFGGMFIRRKYGANLIVDGSITADHLAANSVTATSIAASAITADKIATNAVTASKINVTSLSAISATLGNVDISNANIGTLTVGTSNIAPGAITKVEITDFPSSVSWGANGTYNITVTIAHGTNSGLIKLTGKVDVNYQTTETQATVTLWDVTGSAALSSASTMTPKDFMYQSVSLFWSFQPPSGRSSTTFGLSIAGGLGNGQVKNRYIEAMQLKR